jgi:hypothetical protein
MNLQSPQTMAPGQGISPAGAQRQAGAGTFQGILRGVEKALDHQTVAAPTKTKGPGDAEGSDSSARVQPAGDKTGQGGKTAPREKAERHEKTDRSEQPASAASSLAAADVTLQQPVPSAAPPRDRAADRSRHPASEPLGASSSAGGPPPAVSAGHPLPEAAKTSWSSALAKASAHEPSASTDVPGRLQVQFQDPHWVVSSVDVQTLADGALELKLHTETAGTIASQDLDSLKRRLQEKGWNVAGIRVVSQADSGSGARDL